MMNTMVKPLVREEIREELIKRTGMKAYYLFTVTGPMVILTSYESIDTPGCLRMLRSRGFSKFIAHEIPLALASGRYGGHFTAVCNDPDEDDTLRILDYKSERAINIFSFKEFGPPIYYEYEEDSPLLNKLPDYEAEYLRVYPKYD